MRITIPNCKYSLPKIFTIVFLLIILTASLATYETDQKSYFAVAVYLALFFLIFTKRPAKIIGYPVIISAIMIAVWLYGFVLGVVLKNGMSNVVRNFAGMATYVLVVPLLNSDVVNDGFVKIIKGVANYALFITLFTYFVLTFYNAKFVFNIPVISAFVGLGGVGGFVQYFCRELIHVSFAYHLYQLLYTNNRGIWSLVMLILIAIESVVVNDSGGDLFAMCILALTIMISQFHRTTFRAVLLASLGVCFLLCFLIYYGTGPLSLLFSLQDIGNARRMDQIQYFMENWSFVGWGLGSALGSFGNKTYNYGTEMIYFNLFHKFGIMAMLVIMCYMSTVLRAYKHLKQSRDANGVIPIALMAYLITSLANPMLFSTISVLSHILAMILMTRKEGKPSLLKENLA